MRCHLHAACATRRLPVGRWADRIFSHQELLNDDEHTFLFGVLEAIWGIEVYWSIQGYFVYFFQHNHFWTPFVKYLYKKWLINYGRSWKFMRFYSCTLSVIRALIKEISGPQLDLMTKKRETWTTLLGIRQVIGLGMMIGRNLQVNSEDYGILGLWMLELSLMRLQHLGTQRLKNTIQYVACIEDKGFFDLIWTPRFLKTRWNLLLHLVQLLPKSLLEVRVQATTHLERVATLARNKKKTSLVLQSREGSCWCNYKFGKNLHHDGEREIGLRERGRRPWRKHVQLRHEHAIKDGKAICQESKWEHTRFKQWQWSKS